MVIKPEGMFSDHGALKNNLSINSNKRLTGCLNYEPLHPRVIVIYYSRFSLHAAAGQSKYTEMVQFHSLNKSNDRFLWVTEVHSSTLGPDEYITFW